MARFDVYRSPLDDERHHTPYWLDVQADHLSQLATRVVVPLCRIGSVRPFERLNPIVVVDGVSLFADTSNLGTFPKQWLRQPVATLREQRFVIEDALDFLLTGH
ncbi:CcdB family protein [Inhella gelatinilytica]|uniref:Toxin CcdB n=1 Tax=Inhella gelatinilytica TaxID=2795030 RepID=A0A931IUH5_9BURK|nr:CcdB family protein [Inhella gelatinilytica]MBH9553012.1 CcdB family protein [Inhella gelatinilytica]